MRITSRENKYKDFIEHLLVSRAQRGSLESEVDFIAGAGAVFAFLNRMDLVPPMWIFWPLGGRSIVEELVKEQPGSEYQKKLDWLIDNESKCPKHCR